ncbi:hypothetical protein Tco_0343326, partial [Tanacetum coccineum]
SCGELDDFVSIPDEGVMAFLRKKVKSGAAVGKRVLLRYEAIIPSTGASVFAFDMRYCQGFGVMSSMR